MRKLNISVAAVLGGVLAIASNGAALAAPAQSEHWETPAKWHRLLKKRFPEIWRLIGKV